MDANFLDAYLQIAKEFEHIHSGSYVSAESQAENIKLCSILKDVPIEYSNSTSLSKS